MRISTVRIAALAAGCLLAAGACSENSVAPDANPDAVGGRCAASTTSYSVTDTLLSDWRTRVREHVRDRPQLDFGQLRS